MSPSRSRRNRWGTVFLVAAASGFAFVSFQPWWSAETLRFVRAFFEASLVGALADWFAVTALFKKPLGLPLPHTDVLVRRKDQLVEALPRFLGTFLEPERLNPVLRSVDWAALVLDRFEPAALDELFASGWKSLAESPTREVWEASGLDLGTELLYRELSRHKEALVGPVTDLIKRNAGWKGLFVSRDTVDEAVDGLLEELKAVRDRPEHPFRATVKAALREAWPRWAEQLKPSRWTADTWGRLEADPAFRSTFNRRAGELAVALWEKAEATKAITTALGYLLSQTDARNLASRIEAAVGNDLQYIRVNGALVGGLAGLFLELFRR